MILESTKVTNEVSCSEKEFFEKIKFQKRLFEENLTLYNLSKTQRLSRNESKTYYANLQEIINSINSLVIHEHFTLYFRNNQIINALILDSLNMVFRIKKQRRSLINLVVKMLNLSIVDGDFDDVLNAKWFQNLLHGFFLSKKHQLIEFFQENETDFSNKVEIIEFMTYMYRIVNVYHIVPCEFLIKSIKYLRSICNEKNVDQFSKAISVILGKLNFSLIAIGQSSNKPKYFEVLSCAKDQVIFLLKNYEKSLIENAQSQLVFQLIYRLKTYRSLFPEVDSFGLQLFDLILKLFENKIDNYYTLKQEYAMKILEFYDEQIYTYLTTDGQIVKQRYQRILNLMVKIIIKSENFDFTVQSDVEFTNFAYEYIYYVFKQECKLPKIKFVLKISKAFLKDYESDFMPFFESIWPQIKETWLKTIKHEKGSMALRISIIFFKTYDSNHSDMLDFFIKSLNQFLEYQDKYDNKKIDKCFQKSLINLIELADKMENVADIKEKLNSLILFYFKIGSELDYYDWLLCFKIFNDSLVDKKFSFIFQNDELSEKFFGLVITQLKIEVIPKICLQKFSSSMCKFLFKLIKNFQNRLNLESKYILIEYLDYMSLNVNNAKVKSSCQKIIQNVNF